MAEMTLQQQQAIAMANARARAAQAAPQAPPAAPAAGGGAPSWSQSLLSAPGAALSEAGNALSNNAQMLTHNAIQAMGDPGIDPITGTIGRTLMGAAKAAPGAIASDLGGMAQYVRNLSAPQYRGSAPAFAGGEPEQHPYLALTQGDTAPMRQAIATHPLSTAADALSVAALSPEVRAGMGAISDLGAAPFKAVGRGIADLAPARRAEKALLAGASQTSDPQTLARLLEQSDSNVPGVSFTAAQATQDPGMIALERQSRMDPTTQGAWAMHDTGQNTAMFNALHGIVNPFDDAAVQAARDTRDAATKHLRKGALSLADQGSLEPMAGLEAGNALADQGLQARDYPEQFSGPIRTAAQEEMVTGPRAQLPAVRTTTNYVLGAVPQEGASAEQTYEVRKYLADALNARAGQQLGDIPSAIKSAGVTTRTIKNAMDSSLNTASGGMWQDYLDAFKANSKDVNSAQALNNIRSDLQDKIAGGMTDLQGNPKLTLAFINQIIENNSTNKYGKLIAPEIQDQLDAVRTAAQRIESPQANYRLAVTGGSGSNTAADVAARAAGHLASGLIPGGGVGKALVNWASSAGEQGGATRLAALLQNPQDAANALRSAAARAAARKVGSSGVTPALLAATLASQPQ
jgi:hypothetical protein